MEANTMNPDQIAPLGAIRSGSMLFAITSGVPKYQGVYFVFLTSKSDLIRALSKRPICSLYLTLITAIFLS